jgi:hypothetical protein
MCVYGGREEDENEEDDKNGDCEFLKEYISVNISNIFHLVVAVYTISK